jgi:hypothetical protein
MKQLCLSLTIILLPLFTQGQQILNGSFEQHTAQNCMWFGSNNNDNPFNNLKVIGYQNEVWLIPGDCSYLATGGADGGAQDSTWFIALVEGYRNFTYSNTKFSLKISEELTEGQWYKLSYYQKSPPFPQDTFNWHYKGAHATKIRLATDSSSWGVPIYTSPVVDTVWTLLEVVFQAPADIRYIGCHSVPSDPIPANSLFTGVYLDNFSLSAISDIASVKQKVKLYPNPCRQKFKLDNKEEWDTALLTDALGRVVLEHHLEVGLNQINVSHLNPGSYLLVLLRGDKQLAQQQIQIIR